VLLIKRAPRRLPPRSAAAVSYMLLSWSNSCRPGSLAFLSLCVVSLDEEADAWVVVVVTVLLL
jgi:hypothetical protein